MIIIFITSSFLGGRCSRDQLERYINARQQQKHIDNGNLCQAPINHDKSFDFNWQHVEPSHHFTFSDRSNQSFHRKKGHNQQLWRILHCALRPVNLRSHLTASYIFLFALFNGKFSKSQGHPRFTNKSFITTSATRVKGSFLTIHAFINCLSCDHSLLNNLPANEHSKLSPPSALVEL